jgi:hypothetical protein
MAQVYQQPAVPVAATATDSVQERIENGVNIEEVQSAYLQIQTRCAITNLTPIAYVG